MDDIGCMFLSTKHDHGADTVSIDGNSNKLTLSKLKHHIDGRPSHTVTTYLKGGGAMSAPRTLLICSPEAWLPMTFFFALGKMMQEYA